MLSEPPVQYAALFFLGLMLYTPVILFSTGKYKDGLKCAAAICLWMIMMASAARLVSTIYPQAIKLPTADPESELRQRGKSPVSKSTHIQERKNKRRAFLGRGDQRGKGPRQTKARVLF